MKLLLDVDVDVVIVGNAASRLHFGNRISQTLTLPLLERIDESLSVFRAKRTVRWSPLRPQFGLAECWCPSRGVNRFYLPVVGGNGEKKRGQEQRNGQKAVIADFASFFRISMLHPLFLFPSILFAQLVS
jgi:hypothetical protein